METICMKCQILFPGKYKKNIMHLSSAEFAQRVVKIKAMTCIWVFNPLGFFLSYIHVHICVSIALNGHTFQKSF